MPVPNDSAPSLFSLGRESNIPTTGRWSTWRSELCAAILIAVAVAIIGARNLTSGGLGWSDAPNHFFDGVFVFEFLRDLPLEHSRAWAEQFYLRHPSLGILVYWPPGFAVVEAVAFLLFGVNLIAARCVVLAFAFGAAYLMYRIGRMLFDDATGLIAALLLLTCPAGERWMTDVMLEWPATFWILLAVWGYLGCVDFRFEISDLKSMGTVAGASAADRVGGRLPVSLNAKPIWLGSALCGVAVAMAFLTKQTAGFILPVIALHAVCSSVGRRWLTRGRTIIGFSICLAIVAAYSVFARRYAALPALLLAVDVDPFWYAMKMPEIVGWFALGLAALGVGAAVWRWRDDGGFRGWSLLLIWFVSWYAFSSAIEAKEPRYLFFALVPVMFLAARGVVFATMLIVRLCIRRELPDKKAKRSVGDGGGGRVRWYRSLTVAALIDRAVLTKRAVSIDRAALVSRAGLIGVAVIVLVVQATVTIGASAGRLPSFSPAVDLLVARGNADLVMIDAVRDGQFVLDLQQNAEARGRIIPLRASKMLYARAARMKYDGRLLVETEGEIVALLDRYGIRYIVMESQPPVTNDGTIDPLPRQLLRTLVADEARFALRGAWPLRCGDPAWEDVELRVYEYLDCPVRTSDQITLPIPAMGRDVEIELPYPSTR